MSRHGKHSAHKGLLEALWASLDGLPWWGCLLEGAIWWLMIGLAGRIFMVLAGPFRSIVVIVFLFAQVVVLTVCFIAAAKAMMRRPHARTSSDFTENERSTKETNDSPSFDRGAVSPTATQDRVADEYRSPLTTDRQPKAPHHLDNVSEVELLFDVIEWRRFEAVVERCMQLQGFSTSSKPHGPDGGIDIKLYLDKSPDELAGVVQCKHWGNRLVGVDTLRAFRGAMTEFKTEHGYFVTSSIYTPDALAFARRNGIHAIDRHSLIKTILAFETTEKTSILRVALQGRYDVPTCASCGTKMVKRTPSRGGQPFWGCLNYPCCRNIIKIKHGN